MSINRRDFFKKLGLIGGAVLTTQVIKEDLMIPEKHDGVEIETIMIKNRWGEEIWTFKVNSPMYITPGDELHLMIDLKAIEERRD